VDAITGLDEMEGRNISSLPRLELRPLCRATRSQWTIRVPEHFKAKRDALGDFVPCGSGQNRPFVEHIASIFRVFLKVMGFHSCVTVESMLNNLSKEGYYIRQKNTVFWDVSTTVSIRHFFRDLEIQQILVLEP
jgi:hypothetical protein